LKGIIGPGWSVRLHDAFEPEFAALAEAVQDELLALLALLALLKEYGPELGRPHADTLNGSGFANMKELRFRVDGGVWRVTYAFDPAREGLLLAAGNKSGVSERRFYRQLIARSDERFAAHLRVLEQKGK
jgi:hypothetical protein